jgi:PAS domain S-box-containing protein
MGAVTDWSGQERLAALIEHSVHAVLILDAGGVIRWANPASSDVLGATPAEMMERRALELFPAGACEGWRPFVEDLLSQPGASRSVMLRCHHNGGQCRWIAVEGRNLVTDARVDAIVIAFKDLTEALQAQESAWRAAEGRYRQLIEDAADVIFETDHDGRFVLANPATSRLLGCSDGELLGRRVSDFIRPDYRSIVADHYRRQMIAGESASYLEYPVLTRDKREVWLGQNAWLTTDANGRFHGLRAVARDIGERRQAEEALLQAQKMDAVGRLAGGIAHDFNNLLTAIRGNAELLLHHLRADPARAADVEEILHAADRAATMTRQLLAFSRKQSVTPIRLDVNDLAESVARLSRRLIGPEIALEIQAAADLHAVMADTSQLEQLLLNLILNARDAMPGGGRIIVRTSNRQLPDGAAESARAGVPDGAYVLLQVIDNGVGMDQATQERIFEPFFTTKEPGRGTGLGLSTVYGIVRQMGGGVTVLSDRNQGATFSVFLPAAVDNKEITNA